MAARPPHLGRGRGLRIGLDTLRSCLPAGVRRACGQADLLQLELLASVPGIAHAFETRNGSLADAMPSPVARLQQIHGAVVHRLPATPEDWDPFLEDAPRARPAGDALITDTTGVTVAVAVADCLPILIGDPQGRAVAAVHGGWRGLAAGVVAATLDMLRQHFDCPAKDCIVGIGPGIGPCCYRVGSEVIEAFAARGLDDEALASGNAGAASVSVGAGEHTLHCDLSTVATAQLLRAGVPEAQIAVADLCTRCHADHLWSYREEGEMAGRMLCGIALQTT